MFPTMAILAKSMSLGEFLNYQDLRSKGSMRRGLINAITVGIVQVLTVSQDAMPYSHERSYFSSCPLVSANGPLLTYSSLAMSFK